MRPAFNKFSAYNTSNTKAVKAAFILGDKNYDQFYVPLERAHYYSIYIQNIHTYIFYACIILYIYIVVQHYRRGQLAIKI